MPSRGLVQCMRWPVRVMTVLNNQSAVLNVAQNQVYFEIISLTTTNDNVTQTTVDSEIRNVPEGVIINVQPSIDLDDRKFQWRCARP
jgi:MSHA biogenesis protein MshL